jgi:hypothetical protein
MTKRRKTSSYRGELLQQIKLADPRRWARRFSPIGPFLVNSETKVHESREIELTIQKRLPLLFEHFGIDENDADHWQQLALALARSHVPGFQAVRKGGAPNKNSVYLLCRLYRYFIRTKADRIQRISSRAPSVNDICVSWAKNEEFKRAFPELQSVSVKTLQNLVGEARKLRRERVAATLHNFSRKRSLGSDWPGDFALVDNLPDWIYEGPSSFFLKYGEDQNS